MGLPALAEIRAAAELIYRSMPPTPQYSWPLINQRAHAEVWIKHENHTPVGAFKIRGGLSYMNWLTRAQPKIRAVVSATRGNHGQSIAFAAAQHGIRAVMVIPHGNSTEKNQAMRALGAELIEHGTDFQSALEHAAHLEQQNGWHWVPSYHPLLITGVATYALEFLSACPQLETVYVPIGLGSGISGMIAVRDALRLSTKIVGVVSKHAPATALSLAAGHIVEHPAATRIADGVANRRPNVNALEVLRSGMERIVEIDDDEAESAMRAYFTDTHNVAEGSGALGLAALLKDRSTGGNNVGTVLTGGNVDRDVFAAVLANG